MYIHAVQRVNSVVGTEDKNSNSNNNNNDDGDAGGEVCWSSF